ncbi:MAG: ribosome-associated protein, partial [Planctomycetota bacterium]
AIDRAVHIPPPSGDIVIESRQLAAAAAYIADQKKGVDITVYDVSDQIKFADYFVVITGTSRPHVRAMYDSVHYRLKAAEETHARAEGVELGWWVLADFGDVIVHVLQPEARDFYGLDELYAECPKVDWEKVDLPEIPEEKI